MLIETALSPDKRHWLIVSNPRPTTTGGVLAKIDEPEPVTLEWDWCWTGDRWSSTHIHAMQFESEDAAQHWLDENIELLAESYGD